MQGNGLAAMQAKPYTLVPGLIKSDVPGRTDQIAADIPQDDYILPADVVSGLGQGNTLAGAKILDHLFLKGPYKPTNAATGLAAGGTPHVPVVVAGGEYRIPKEWLASIGGGDITKGHDILDKMVLKVRSQVKAHLGKLPRPKR